MNANLLANLADYEIVIIVVVAAVFVGVIIAALIFTRRRKRSVDETVLESRDEVGETPAPCRCSKRLRRARQKCRQSSTIFTINCCISLRRQTTRWR